MPASQPAEIPAAPIPRSFGQYLRSFGPGLVVVLTWLGAGDIVDMSVAGSQYGYSLMWVLVLAVVMRFLFVSLIAKYQLCNQHGESVLDGLVRLHRWYAPVLLAAAVVMGHAYGSYMTVGIGEAFRNVTGVGEVWQWALLWNGVALLLVFQSAYGRVEVVFKVLLALLTVSFIGAAVWVGPNPQGILQGLHSLSLPEQTGKFDPLLVAVAMIGAVGGSLMNLVYPYFLEQKGWRGPQYRRVQLYDFLLAIVVMILVDLAIWTLGAELLHEQGLEIKEMDDLPWLMSLVLGRGGEVLFYAGIFAAVFTSLVGHALGLGYMGSHAFLRWRAGSGPIDTDYRRHPLCRYIIIWCLVSPLIWTLPGMPDFVTLTLIVNAAQVVLLPVIAGGLWWITASARFIGAEYRNRWWENLVMAVLIALAVYSAKVAVESVASTVRQMTSEAPTDEEQQAETALRELGAEIKRDDNGHVLSVDLSETNMTDTDLQHLLPLGQLEVLSLRGTSLTDAALVYLNGLRSLKRLDLRDTEISSVGVERLNRALKKCTIQQ